MRFHTRAAALLSTAAIFSACKPADKPAETPPAPVAAVPTPPAVISQKPDSLTYAPALAVDLTKMTKDSTGVYSRDLKVGKGAAAAVGKTVMVRYTGWTADGQQFDTNQAEGYPLTIGEHRVIAGWESGLIGMKVGGKRQLVIPPAQGYGDAGMAPIPGGAVLVFTVELMSVK